MSYHATAYFPSRRPKAPSRNWEDITRLILDEAWVVWNRKLLGFLWPEGLFKYANCRTVLRTIPDLHTPRHTLCPTSRPTNGIWTHLNKFSSFFNSFWYPHDCSSSSHFHIQNFPSFDKLSSFVVNISFPLKSSIKDPFNAFDLHVF